MAVNPNQIKIKSFAFAVKQNDVLDQALESVVDTTINKWLKQNDITKDNFITMTTVINNDVSSCNLNGWIHLYTLTYFKP